MVGMRLRCKLARRPLPSPTLAPAHYERRPTHSPAPIVARLVRDCKHKRRRLFTRSPPLRRRSPSPPRSPPVTASKAFAGAAKPETRASPQLHEVPPVPQPRTESRLERLASYLGRSNSATTLSPHLPLQKAARYPKALLYNLLLSKPELRNPLPAAAAITSFHRQTGSMSISEMEIVARIDAVERSLHHPCCASPLENQALPDLRHKPILTPPLRPRA
jgi:hypothetical protein